MSDSSGLRLGKRVPDFELTVYDPVKDDFGKFSLAQQIANKRWTVLFFYPADFTFV
jgi:peroxiredoxin (alkyl hydroperoxide reductase subunit C)